MHPLEEALNGLDKQLQAEDNGKYLEYGPFPPSWYHRIRLMLAPILDKLMSLILFAVSDIRMDDLLASALSEWESIISRIRLVAPAMCILGPDICNKVYAETSWNNPFRRSVLNEVLEYLNRNDSYIPDGYCQKLLEDISRDLLEQKKILTKKHKEKLFSKKINTGAS